MITVVDDRLREEARRYHLVFACPDCVSFEPECGGCSLGFPNEMHRDPSLDGRDEVVFCKAFELA
jgi:hypothetical protein